MAQPVINIDQLEYKRFGKGDRFEAERAPVISSVHPPTRSSPTRSSIPPTRR